MVDFRIIVDLRINETLPIGEVGNLAYRGAKAVIKPHLPGSESVYLFLEFTILRHSQCLTNPLNPPCQGDLGNLAKVGTIGNVYLFLLFTIVFSHFPLASPFYRESD